MNQHQINQSLRVLNGFFNDEKNAVGDYWGKDFAKEQFLKIQEELFDLQMRVAEMRRTLDRGRM